MKISVPFIVLNPSTFRISTALLLVLMGTPHFARAREPVTFLPPIVVDANRIDSALAEPGPSTTIIREPEIARAATVGEILRDQLGLRLNESGPAGQPTTLFVRGAPSEQTLVLLDGIELNDSTSTSRGFNFANLSTENIERIEIFRGPESLRFASTAAGGVINIISKKGDGPLTVHYNEEAGSYRTGRAAIGLSGSRNRFHYSLAAGTLASEGFSAAKGGTESDSARRYSLLTRLGWDFSPTSEFDFTYRAFFNRADLDYGGGAAGDDPNYISNQREHSAGAVYKVRLAKGHLQSTFAAHDSNIKRDYDNDPDPVHPDDYHETFQGETQSFEARQEYTFNSVHATELVLQYRSETARSRQLFSGFSDRLEPQHGAGFGKALIHKIWRNRFQLLTGVRHDDTLHSGSALTYSVVPAYTIAEKTILRASYSTGFRAPSLFQLYSSFGNRELKPENAKAWEVSAEHEFSEQAFASVTYFENRYSELIDFDTATSAYANIARAKTKGFETRALWRLSPISLELNHTYIEAKNDVTGLRLFRRPSQALALKAAWSKGAWDVQLGLRYTGEREDSDPTTFQRTFLPAYQTLGGEVRYALRSQIHLRLWVENILNAKFEDTAGYNTPGTSVYFGVNGDL